MLEICRNQVHTGTPHAFSLTTSAIICVFVKKGASEHWWNSSSYTRSRHFATFMLSTSSKVLQSLNYAGIKSTQVPHTYSVSQQLSPYVYLCRNRHPQTTRIHRYICVFRYFYALNLWQSAAITELCRKQVLICSPHIFCLTTTTIICVLVKQ